MLNPSAHDDKRNELNEVKDFLEKNAVELTDEEMFDESPEEVIIYAGEGE